MATHARTLSEAIDEALSNKPEREEWNPYADHFAQLDADLKRADRNPEWAKTLPATRQHDIAMRREHLHNKGQEQK